MGGYEDWLERLDNHHQRMQRTRELANLSLDLAKASGGNLTEGAAQVAEKGPQVHALPMMLPMAAALGNCWSLLPC
jgi:hypothetical protein